MEAAGRQISSVYTEELYNNELLDRNSQALTPHHWNIVSRGWVIMGKEGACKAFSSLGWR